MIQELKMFASLTRNMRAFGALLSWPKFSLTSYLMVSRLKQQGIEPKTVIDIGANVGQFCVAAAKLFPGVWVHSFEPLPKCLVKLRRNTVKLSNVVVHPVALGEKKCELLIYVNDFSHSSSFLPLSRRHRTAFPKAREREKLKVKVSTLDQICEHIQLMSPVMVKLDVQGYESYVIRGGSQTLRLVEYVIVETSFTPMYEGETLFFDLIKLMDEYGFLFLRPVGWLSDPMNGEILQMDALFSRKT